MRVLPTLAAAAAVSFGAFAAVPGARAQSASDHVWVQYEADGVPHVRAIGAGGTCPALTVGGASTPLAVRAGPAAGFSDTVCDLVLPANVAGAHVGAIALPAIPRAPKTIALFGDTGCRLLNDQVQACNDPLAWPFPAIARDVAAAHPDLVIHVGDYYYRETPCPGTANCANSPHGDIAASWVADYFAPMAPVFAVAPIINVRGNHEDCKRSPLGWARYLDGTTAVACVAHEPPSFVAFDDLVVGNVDDATEVTETLPSPPLFASDEAAVDARAAVAGRETWLVAHRPPVAYEASHENADAAGAHLAAVISGHIHTFGAYTIPGEPPQVLVGMGGDNLAADAETVPLAVFGGLTDRRFGYALFERRGNGWDIVVHDADTAVHRRCRLAARTVTCGPALTGASR